jgi:hypothetical protein
MLTQRLNLNLNQLRTWNKIISLFVISTKGEIFTDFKISPDLSSRRNRNDSQSVGYFVPVPYVLVTVRQYEDDSDF